jgi:hypothetical protein
MKRENLADELHILRNDISNQQKQKVYQTLTKGTSISISALDNEIGHFFTRDSISKIIQNHYQVFKITTFKTNFNRDLLNLLFG